MAEENSRTTALAGRPHLDVIAKDMGRVRVRIPADGNCFFAAIVKVAAHHGHYAGNETTLRKELLDYAEANKADWLHLFESESFFLTHVSLMRQNAIWTCDLADYVPYMCSRYLKCPIVIYEYRADRVVRKYEHGQEEPGPVIELFRACAHYDALLPLASDSLA
jgi:hypothetical protein